MKIYDSAFYSIFFFLFGVLIAGFKFGLPIYVFIVFLTAALFLFFGYFKKSPKLFWFAGLSLFIIVGAFYCFWYDSHQNKNINIVFDRKINFSGIVADYPERGGQQKLVVDLNEPYRGKILTKLQPYPSFNYGDSISFGGTIKKPSPESYDNYLAKDGIFGTTDFPKTELIAVNQGSKIKTALFNIKEKTVGVFQKVLPSEKAAFLSGITLGERAEFSKELKQRMKNSGTTHLVALSGYNISIIILAVFNVFIFLGRRWAFVLSVLLVAGFVLMTGAEASVVRAALMGGIALIAQQIGRLYSFRNAIAAAAFLMVLGNPKVLSFDVGFQLSFLSLLGIVYLMPAIKKLLRFVEEPGFLSWRENFLTTVSAQLAVAPLLVFYFGNFSPTSFLANVLILTIIPLTMTLGFLLGFLGFIYPPASLVFGWFINLFLYYEIFIIKLFG